MWEEGYKRYNSVTILKIFGKTDHLKANQLCTDDGSITYKTFEDKIPRFAVIRGNYLESYTIVNGDCSISEHKISDFKDEDTYQESIFKEFARALKENLTVNLVIVVVKKGHNVEFVSKAEFI